MNTIIMNYENCETSDIPTHYLPTFQREQT